MFRELLGDSSRVRVLDFFLDNSQFSYSMADIMKWGEISLVTVRPILKEFVKEGILIPDGKKRGAVTYKLNDDNPVVQKIKELNETLVDVSVEEYLASEEYQEWLREHPEEPKQEEVSVKIKGLYEVEFA